jgi:hypothetical protein
MNRKDLLTHLQSLQEFSVQAGSGSDPLGRYASKLTKYISAGSPDPSRRPKPKDRKEGSGVIGKPKEEKPRRKPGNN